MILLQQLAAGMPVFAIITTSFLILLLLGSLAMISAAEVAFFSLKPSQLREIRLNERESDDLVAVLLRDPKRLLATILILVNFLNVTIVILSALVSQSFLNLEQYPLAGFFIQVILVTVLILFFGEILPKVYASQYPEKLAVMMAPPLKLLIRICYPLSQLLISSTRFVDRRIAGKYANISMSELDEAIDITTNENTPEDEKSILKGIVNFGETDVRDIMKPRIFITAIEFNTTFRELLQLIRDSGFSRIPVYKENLDHVSGLLYIKDLLPHLDREDDFRWQEMIRPAFFVPENKKIIDLLQEFQRKKIHLAIVADEYGGTSGIITLEDVLEEIVGEINDEFDTDSEESWYKKLDNHNFIFPGETPVNDFCRIIRVDPDIFEEARGESGTLAGLILEITGSIPEVHEKVSFKRFIFRIENVDQRRILEIKVTLTDASEE
ncbi:MAG TPA: gliding motility-associated protein GldE [Bacteroidales bacterium]|nr:gliding motility-associated protein GldE [Bacteroidales bacterium]HSA42118.1 gliding motility-associated protein GldE [Bacteroidales bacterium]